ncbi:dehydrogenase with different specificitie [Aspergillus insuetus]
MADTRPTAQQIIEDEHLVDGLSGAVVLITGCSAGIGIETAKAMYKTGATLYLTTRTPAKAYSALGNLLSNTRVHLLELDLASLENVRACAAEFLAKNKTLDILICNAGEMMPNRSTTKDGFETHFGANYLGHFLLVNLLLTSLEASATPERASRLVMLSSIAHRWAVPNFDDLNSENGYNGMLAYGASKTGNIWTANEVERRWGSKGIHTWSVDPGAIITELDRNWSDEDKIADRTNPVKLAVLKTPAQGAASTVWAAIARELEGKGGGYIQDCEVTKMWDGSLPFGPGYAPHAVDEEKQKRLWDMSAGLLNL